MTRVLVDPATLSRLENATETAELHDASGRIVGYFTPVNGSAIYDDEIPLSEEELLGREAETESYTTAEVHAYFKSLEKQPS